MLAEILMVRLEAAARLQEQAASLSSGRFVPFTQSNQSYSTTRRLVLPTDLRGLKPVSYMSVISEQKGHFWRRLVVPGLAMEIGK